MTVTASATVELRYRRGSASADVISAEVQEILADLDNPDSELTKSVRDLGIDVADRSAVTIRVREGGQGFEPFLTPIIVGITVNASTAIGAKLWNAVIWPHLRHRLGPRALLDREDEAEE